MPDIHVSPNGTGDGSPASPCSLDHAVEITHQMNQSMTADIHVLLDGGIYQRTTPIVLGPEDSGTGGYRVRWQNKPGARPVFTGAESITGWSLHDSGQNIWKASVPDGSNFEHLWMNGIRAHRAWSGWNPKEFGNTKRGVKVAASGPDVSGWRNPEEIIVTKKYMWRYIHCKVHEIRDRELLLDPECLKTHKVPRSVLGVSDLVGLYVVLNGYALWTADIAVENAYELLTDEGEWYLDRAESTVFYKPKESDQFGPNSEATYGGLDTFFRLDGTVERPVANLSIEGITFEYNKGTKLGITAGWPTEPTHAKTPQSRAAVRINAGRSIRVASCSFLHIASDAIHFDLGGRNIEVVGNAFGDISRAAISLAQSNLVVDKRSRKGVIPENENKFFEDVEVSHNYIRHTGIDCIGAPITYTEFMHNLRVIHNEIREVPACAVRNGWRYLAWTGHTKQIEYAWNKTSDVGQAGMGDFGALYISCCDDGTASMHHNFVDGAGISDANNALYLDVNVRNAKVYNNVCRNMPGSSGLSRFVPGGWLGLVMTTHTDIHDNWTDSAKTLDFALPAYRFWPSRTNRFRNNFVRTSDQVQWPEEAQEVMDKTGPDPEYRAGKRAIDTELDKGYVPLAELYKMSE